MQFYKIKHAGGIEFDTVRTAAQNRAKETGGSWEAIEMGNDKASLIPFFNDLAKEAAGGAPSAVEQAEPEAPAYEPKGETCKKCKFDYRAQERWLAITLKGLHVQAVKQWIEEREGWELATVVESLMGRLTDIAKIITSKKEAA